MWRPCAACAVLALAACNQLYGLGETVPYPDAPIVAVPDEDGDGVPDELDNCPHVANASQADEDSDSIGNACDNCPLFENAEQEDIGDGDGIGDLCDPQPTLANNCLVLLDTFDDPAAFAQRWQILASTSVADATADPEPGHVMVRPRANANFVLVALGEDGMPITGTFDVQLVGRAALTTGRIAGGARIVDRVTGYWGGIEGDLPLDNMLIENAGHYTVTTDIPTARVGTRFAIRVNVDNPALARPTMYVRGDYGVAIGTLDDTAGNNVSPQAHTGIVARVDDIQVDAFAAYRRQPPPCPPPLVR